MNRITIQESGQFRFYHFKFRGRNDCTINFYYTPNFKGKRYNEYIFRVLNHLPKLSQYGIGIFKTILNSVLSPKNHHWNYVSSSYRRHGNGKILNQTEILANLLFCILKLWSNFEIVVIFSLVLPEFLSVV